MHIVMDMINNLLYKYIYFYVTCVQLEFKCPLREIGRLLSNCLSNRLKLEIS